MTDATTEPHGGLPYACDLVMKGGITSGVVYPAAVHELARDHRFHNIGGSSAGALAAVVTAAAEYGRQTGGGGFASIEGMPAVLGESDASGRTLLQRLFVPQPGTREYFDLFFEQKSFGGGAIRRARSLLPSFLRHSRTVPEGNAATATAFGLPLAGIGWAVAAPAAGTIGFAALASLVGAAVYLGSRAISGATAMVADVQDELAANMHGLCNGNTVGDQIGLTEWLHEKIEEVAGPDRPAMDGDVGSAPTRPLTYGDLRSVDVGLVTLTTNLSQGASENFPFADETWAFAPDDMEALFPPAVSSYLIARGRIATATERRSAELEAHGLLKLPPADELPIVIGARISLSFPILISAVPLHRRTIERNGDDWVFTYRRVWLSDGGICSNMPVHLFDRPLPSRPTYGISLGTGAIPATDDAGTDPDAAMRLAHRNVARPWKTGSGNLSPIGEITSTTGLLGEVLTTMQNWSDNSTAGELGVRDRVCTIRLGEGEGGMHLDMPGPVIEQLAPRGRAAGENLAWITRGHIPEHGGHDVDRDDADERAEAETQWARHRWTRLRSALLGLDTHLRDVETGWTSDGVVQGGPIDVDVAYQALNAAAADAGFLPYRSRWGSGSVERLPDLVQELITVDFASTSTQSPPPFRRLTLSSRDDPISEV